MAMLSLGRSSWRLLLCLIALCSAQCPTTTEGVDPRLLSACSSLSADISSQLAAGAASAGAVLTLTFIPTSVPVSTTALTSAGSSSTLALLTSVQTSSTTTAVPQTSSQNGGVGDVGASVTSTTPAVTSSATSVEGVGTTNAGGVGAQPSEAPSSVTQASLSAPVQTSSTGAGAAGNAGLNQAASTGNGNHYRNTVVIPAAVVCSVVGALLIAALLWFCLVFRKQRRNRRSASSGDSAAPLNEADDVDDEKRYVGLAPGNEAGGLNSHAMMKETGTGGLSNGADPVAQSLVAPPAAAAIPAPSTEKETEAPPEQRATDRPYVADSPNRSSVDLPTAPPWASQPLKHFRRRSLRDTPETGTEGIMPGPGPTAGSTGGLVGSSPRTPPPTGLLPSLPTNAAAQRHYVPATSRTSLNNYLSVPGPSAAETTSAELPGDSYHNTYSSPARPGLYRGLSDLEEASVEDSASFYSESQAGVSPQPSADPLERGQSTSAANPTVTGGRNALSSTGPQLITPGPPGSTTTSTAAYLRGLSSGGLEEAYAGSTPRAATADATSWLEPDSARTSQQPPPRSDVNNAAIGNQTRPTSSGLWSGLTDESDQWWTSGVSPEPGSQSRAIGASQSPPLSAVPRSGTVTTGNAQIVEGPWRGELGLGSEPRSETGSEHLASARASEELLGGYRRSEDMEASAGGLVHGQDFAPTTSSRPYSIPRKPVGGMRDDDVGIAQ